MRDQMKMIHIEFKLWFKFVSNAYKYGWLFFSSVGKAAALFKFDPF